MSDDLPEYDSRKRDESILWQIYVLELEGGYFYVGITLDLTKRFEEHLRGEGANFTRLHPPIRILESTCSETCDQKKAEKLENQKTLEYAARYGGDKVKGGKHFRPSKLIRKVENLRSQSAAAPDSLTGIPQRPQRTCEHHSL